MEDNKMNLPIKPVLIKLDVTNHWLDEEFVKRCGKIYDVFIFDDNIDYHLCSLTPSKELQYLYSYSKNEIDDNDDMTLREYAEDFIYIDSKDISKYETKELEEEIWDKEAYETYDEWYHESWESLVEHYNANWSI